MAGAQQMLGDANSIIMEGHLGVITVCLCFCLGQAGLAATEQNEKLTEYVSNLAWDFAVKEGFRVFKEMPPQNHY